MLRHLAEDRDGLGPWGWARHDGRSFGRQVLRDGGVTALYCFFFKRQKKSFATIININILAGPLAITTSF